MDHAPETPAVGHGHDHGHAHDHGGGEYYLQQLLTIFICGAFGVSGLLMYFLKHEVLNDEGQTILQRKIGFLIVDPTLQLWMLIGSIVLLVVTVIRGIGLWQAAGAKHDHSHDHAGHNHAPGEACDHPAHAQHGHDHSDHSADDHSHGNIYWRIIVLAFPVAILAMGLPNGTFSKDYQFAMVGRAADLGAVGDVASKEGIQSDFELLASAAFSPDRREAFTGQTATITGQIKKLPGGGKQFTLFKWKMTCCTADQIPLKATCIVPKASDLDGIVDSHKVKVTGQIQFSQDLTSGEYVTVLKVGPNGIIDLEAKGK